MKPAFYSLLVLALGLSPVFAEPKTHTVRFEENIPYGVSAWNQSERVRKGIGKETRFVPYDAAAAGELTNDALVERGGGEKAAGDPRETAFWQAYDEKGWYIYVESKEPLIGDLVNQLVDPRSAGHKESYELFFSPGLKDVPYHQIFINPYQEKVTFYDWGTPHSEYRSLKDHAKVESLPLKDGVGTFVFIPWHLLYEHAPLDGGDWRFTLIRWMPFGKAGGVTWGGRVHETGRFGQVRFEKPNGDQRAAMEKRLLQYAWYKFQADSDQLKEYWSDEHIGDPKFYESVLAPEIARLNAAGEVMGNLRDLMEFDYRCQALRTNHLKQTRLAGE